MKLIFFIIWSKFSTNYYKNQTSCLPTFWGKVLHHPTNISPMTNLSAIPYTVSKKGHMIWHVIVLNTILIYSFILEILNFNDLFSYCPSKKKVILKCPTSCLWYCGCWGEWGTLQSFLTNVSIDCDTIQNYMYWLYHVIYCTSILLKRDL